MTLIDVFLLDVRPDRSGRCRTLYQHEQGTCYGAPMHFTDIDAYHELKCLLLSEPVKFSEKELVGLIDIKIGVSGAKEMADAFNDAGGWGKFDKQPG